MNRPLNVYDVNDAFNRMNTLLDEQADLSKEVDNLNKQMRPLKKRLNQIENDIASERSNMWFVIGIRSDIDGRKRQGSPYHTIEEQERIWHFLYPGSTEKSMVETCDSFKKGYALYYQEEIQNG